MIGYELNFIEDLSIEENRYSNYSDTVFEGQSQKDWDNWFKNVIPSIKENLEKENSAIEFIANEYYGTPDEHDFNTNLEIIVIESLDQFIQIWSPETQNRIKELKLYEDNKNDR